MGCLSLTYQEQRSSLQIIYKNDTRKALEEKSYFFQGVLEKRMHAEKNGANSYRYGFNGQEKDNEIAGEGNYYSWGDYGYDARIGRRINVDPEWRRLPGQSPYSSNNNCPILYTDPDGRFGIPGILAGAIGGAIGGLVIGLIQGKRGQELMGSIAGGMIAGAVVGSGVGLIALAGGVNTIGVTGAVYITGGSSIVAGFAGNAAEQLVAKEGTGEEFDDQEFLYAGVMGIPDAILGGAGEVVTEPLKKAVKGILSKTHIEKAVKESRKTYGEGMISDILYKAEAAGVDIRKKDAGKIVDGIYEIMEEAAEVADDANELFGVEVNVAVVNGGIDITYNVITQPVKDELNDLTKKESSSSSEKSPAKNSSKKNKKYKPKKHLRHQKKGNGFK